MAEAMQGIGIPHSIAFGHHFTPCRQTGFQHAFEIRIGTQEDQIRIGFVCVADVAQERAADDAAFAPQEGSIAVIQCPIVVFAGFADQHKALCIRNNFGCQQGLAQSIYPCGFIAFNRGNGFAKQAVCLGALVFKRGHATCKHGIQNYFLWHKALC